MGNSGALKSTLGANKSLSRAFVSGSGYVGSGSGYVGSGSDALPDNRFTMEFPCNLSDCNIALKCKSYTVCKSNADPDNSIEPDNMLGTVEVIDCPPFTYPMEVNVTTNTPGKIALVACREWYLLSDTRRSKISNEGCFKCHFVSKEPCSSTYKYINEKGEEGKWEDCPGGLVIDVQRSSCVDPCHAKGRLNQICRDAGKCISPRLKEVEQEKNNIQEFDSFANPFGHSIINPPMRS